jgi:Tol biopolymer transport system component
VPFLGGFSARWLNWSRDGQSLAGVAYPGFELWRSRADGSEPRRLTFEGMLVMQPRWSPDGTRLAFCAWRPGRPLKIHTMPAEGGPAEPLLPGDRNELDPTWSPDGRRLAYGFFPDWEGPERTVDIRLYDTETKQTSVVPGSEGLFSPRFSPDGRSLVALSARADGLRLHTFGAEGWRALLTGAGLGYPEWTADGRFVHVNQDDRRLSVRVADGQVEELANLARLRPVSDMGSRWSGIAPDGSVISMRDIGIQELYALDLEEP